MSDQTPEGQRPPAPQGQDQSNQETGQDAPSPSHDQSQDENQNSTGEDRRKPTLAELMLGASLEQPNQADEPEEHKPTLAELIAAGKGLPQPDQPPKVETSLRDMVAEALAESDRAQGEQAESQQDTEPEPPKVPDAQPQEPDAEDVQADLVQETAPESAEGESVEAEGGTPQMAAPETPPAVEEEPAAPSPADQVEPSGQAVEERPAGLQVAAEAGAQPESSEPAEAKAPSTRPPRKAAEAPVIVEGPSIVARYGLMRHTGQFRHNLEVLPAPGTMIVVRTHRGVELAEVVSCICDDQRPGCITRERLATYVAANGQNYPLRCEGNVLRVANQQDLADRERISASAKQEAAFCLQCAKEMHLAIKIVSVDHLLGADRIVFYFTADRRVDFRALVQKLSSQYHTRIEMRQVGARDEARLVADYEKCGQRCCCQAFLKDLKPVSMRMAKIQKASLDPAKISGRCGRLMCCMRFEDETYEELRKKLPAKKTWVRTRELCGKVIDTSILAQLVSVSLPDGRSEVIANEEIIERDVRPPATANIGSATGDASPGRSSPAPDQPDDKARAPETQARQAESSASDQEPQNQPPAPAASARAKKRRRPGRSRRRRDKRTDPPDKAEP
ncbi:MAG: hypothetical protein ISS78_00265 [Phycisphaerae bacterium]|nr:hypothetical protein [Phycisphaerae bacterium]